MKVLLIDVNYKNSSTGKIVYDLYTDINASGDIATVAYGRGQSTNDNNVYKFSNDIEMYMHALLTRVTGLTGYFSFFASRKLIKIMKSLKPDVVHIHELHAYFVNLAPVINYLKKNNIKTIWTFHCEFMYTGKCGYAYECNNWKSECNHCPKLKEYPKSLVFDFTKKMFRHKKKLFEGFNNLTIVTPSEWLANRVKQSFLKDKDIRVIHNGIDTDKIFHPRAYDHLKVRHNIKDEKIVLAVAPDLMQPIKGGRLVLELAKRLKNDNIKFILIGIKNLNEDFDENIIALGRTNNQIELAEYYSMADLYIICSERENFPTTCIEALSCGTPIIGFDEGGTKETAPANHGIFIPYDRLDEMEIVIKSFFTGSINLSSKDENARFGKENYSKNRMTDQYISLYKENK